MFNLIIVAVLSLFLGGAITYFVLRNKIKQRIKLDKQTAETNTALKIELAKLEEKQKNLLENENKQFELVRKQYTDQIQNIKKQKEEAKAEMEIELQAKIAEDEKKISQAYAYKLQQLENRYKDAEITAAMNFERNIESLKKQLDEDVQKCTDEYLYLKETCAEEFSQQINKSKKEIDELNSKIAKLKENEHAAVEAAKRAELIRSEENFYRLQIPEEDINEIKTLRAAASSLRNQEPLNKVIWKCYYEKPTSSLISRVVGSEIKTGIYKITNLENNMCYIGQAKDISARFKQHIKRGLGAEPLTKNKLYPAMIQFGVENFSFEIIESCPVDLLDEKEGYWTDYFESKEFGYTVRRV